MDTTKNREGDGQVMLVQSLPQFFELLNLSFEQLPDDLRRLFHGRGCCFPGLEQLTADWLQGQLLIGLFKEPSDEFLQQLIEGLRTFAMTSLWQHSKGSSIVIQHRARARSPIEVVVGELNDFPVAAESGLKYQLELGKNQNMGLFLDMRYGRQWVEQHSGGKRVLNLFAYTCGFSVAAIAGGADHVVNLDMAKSVLSRGRDNHRLNGHDLSKVTFLGHELFKSWGKVKKLGQYDLIIIDPPSFQKGSFALTKDYQKILRRLPDLLSENGEVLACVNSPDVSSDFLIDGMAAEAPALRFIERLENPPEFQEVDSDKGLKVMRFTD